MTRLLIKLFIKDSGNVTSPSVRSAYGKMAGKTGIVCNVLLCVVKFVAGLLTGSVAITADAANNLSDASSSIISLFGFKLAEKSADKEHPYGHARYEYLAGFLVAVLILVIGVELLKSAAEKIFGGSKVEYSAAAMAVLAVSVLVKLWMAVFYTKISRLISSDTLKAAAADSRNDVISTLAVLAGAAISYFTGVELDGIMGALVAVFILYSGIGLVKDAMNPLLGKAPEPELVERIHQKIMSYEGVLGAHDLMIHDYGPGRQFASVHVEMPAERTALECHEVIDKIERDFLKDGLNMLVHLDPIITEDKGVGHLNKELMEIVRGIDGRLSVHDVRTVPCDEKTRVIFDVEAPPGFDMDERALKEEISRFVHVCHPDYICVITVDSTFAPIPKSVPDDED